MVKALDFSGEGRMHKDTSSKDEMARIVQPRFLTLGIIPHNPSIRLKMDWERD